jgi:hypothetical protein
MLPLAEYVAPGKNETALLPDLAQELSYSATYGTKHFLAWQKEHIQRVHAPKYSKWGNLCTAGNTDGMDAVMRATLDRGDHFLVEEFGMSSSCLICVLSILIISVPWSIGSRRVTWLQAYRRTYGFGWCGPDRPGSNHGRVG